MEKRHLKAITRLIRQKSPELLAGIGIAGMITTVVLAVKATPKAVRIIDKLNEESDKPVTKTEVVKATWKCYIPMAIAGTTSIACLVASFTLNAKRNAALTAVYALSETARKEYSEKVTELFGEKKHEEITDAIAKDKIDKAPVSKQEVVITERGDTLCYDSISGRYFRSDIEKLRKAENDLNKRMLSENYLSLNEFYYEIGLDGIKIGDWLGWNVSTTGMISLKFSSQISNDGTPCIVINHDTPPEYDYGWEHA